MSERVVFRVDRASNSGEVFALFPDIPGTSDLDCTAYQHVGQHCAADYGHCIRMSRPATPEEYRDLAEELTGRGYNLRPVKRR